MTTTASIPTRNHETASTSGVGELSDREAGEPARGRLDDEVGAFDGPETSPASPTVGDDREESSSSDGKGDGSSGGSGVGYNADCSSSDGGSDGGGGGRRRRGDTSSSSVPEKEMTSLTTAAGAHSEEDGDQKPAAATKRKEVRIGNNIPRQFAHPDGETNNNHMGSEGAERKQHAAPDDRSTAAASDPTSRSDAEEDVRQHQYNEGESPSQDPQACLPQWNGIRVRHPMDPRIDLSTVGYFRTSELQPLPPSYLNAPKMDLMHNHASLDSAHDVTALNQRFPSGAEVADAPALPFARSESSDDGESGDPPPVPSMEQYMTLMEVNTVSFNEIILRI
jgi:hypothetical protein